MSTVKFIQFCKTTDHFVQIMHEGMITLEAAEILYGKGFQLMGSNQMRNWINPSEDTANIFLATCVKLTNADMDWLPS